MLYYFAVKGKICEDLMQKSGESIINYANIGELIDVMLAFR